ncbi:hypothetical protein CCR75_008246 [Bremia lactucae]|uniref:Uncharacterized protein n=1 Tax=Bremia lactucae TaxID=4779 RepID=A0A976FHX6_BRELC|nr:hypothetical protein CCR75_008246 [Bremia lactucae]
MIIKKVISAIRSKWPNSTRSAAGVIQQDNAKPHISLRVLHYLMGAQSHGIAYKRSDSNKPMLCAYCDANWEVTKVLVARPLASGMDIRSSCQPPNSPDTNVLDFGFFNAVQA